MDQWELPTCSICYERLLSDLALLPKCGHIYHNDCLNTWFDSARAGRRKCPLCRKTVDRDNVISLNYCVSKPAESVASDSTICESAASADNDPPEVADLKSRLAKSSRDNFELCVKVHDLENEKSVLERRVAEEVAERANVAEENKSLKLSHEKQKTTIAGLSNKVSDLKDKLRNLEHVAKYLDGPHGSDAAEIRQFIAPVTALHLQFSSNERVSILVNRVAELERYLLAHRSMVTNLNELYRSTCLERDKIDSKHKSTLREFKSLLNSYFPARPEPKVQLPGLDSEGPAAGAEARRLSPPSQASAGSGSGSTPVRLNLRGVPASQPGSDRPKKAVVTRSPGGTPDPVAARLAALRAATPERARPLVIAKPEDPRSTPTRPPRPKRPRKPRLERSPDKKPATIYRFFGVQPGRI